MRMFNGVFAELAGTADSTPDLYPVALREAIDAVTEWVYPGINNGVYRCGFAKTQEAYDEAIETLYSALDRAEEILSCSRHGPHQATLLHKSCAPQCVFRDSGWPGR